MLGGGDGIVLKLRCEEKGHLLVGYENLWKSMKVSRISNSIQDTNGGRSIALLGRSKAP